MPAYRFPLAVAMILSASLLTARPLSAQQRRNPFGLPDVPGVEDEAARAFGAGVKFPAVDEDANAEPWPASVSDDNPMKLAGVWFSRWNNVGDGDWSAGGKARVAKIGKGLFIRYYSGDDPDSGGYLIEAVRRDDGIYVGRYSVAGADNSSGFWVGRLVSHDRIDGFWTAKGRWDFRRKFE